jgi:CheY-like chemotaxis protein
METPKTVLLVEDDEAVRDVLQDLLEDRGYDVVPATNGKQAIDFLAGETDVRPDVVVLDLMTPLVTGWQVLERLRREPRLAEVPVVVISAITRDRPMGAAAFLKKPFRLDELLATVDVYASRAVT